MLTVAALFMAACVAPGPQMASLSALKAEQRQELYKRCVSEQMKVSPFGSGMAVHQACRQWASRRI